MHHAPMHYTARSAEIWSHGASEEYSETVLFILSLKDIFKFCALGLKELFSSRFRRFSLLHFCHPLLSRESLLPCPLDPPQSPNHLLLLQVWIPPPFSAEITCLQMGPMAGELGGWRTPRWIRQLAPAPGLREVERSRQWRELHNVPRVSF